MLACGTPYFYITGNCLFQCKGMLFSWSRKRPLVVTSQDAPITITTNLSAIKFNLVQFY